MDVFEVVRTLRSSKSRALLLIPLVLSAFTHLWNVTGFPDIFYDEGIYMRRAMHVLEGSGPQEGSFYDHPYFGQLFLAGILRIVGYPNSLGPDETAQSIAELYAAPRIVMGLLAVLDTFLIFKIADKRYDCRVALIASIIFAVMPITWLARRILLDSILLPFLLGSILCALHINDSKRGLFLGLTSGALLGIAIFTKAPSFLMIPLVGYLIYSNSATRRARNLGAWITPVILIPLIWPAYALVIGDFDSWVHYVTWQTQRQSGGIAYITGLFFLFDPVFLLVGAAGIIYSSLKRDFVIMLWTVPFLLFLSVVGYVQYFHWLPLLPVFSIAAARLVTFLLKRQLIGYVIVPGLTVFGLVCTTMVISTDVTSSQFEAAAFVAGYPDSNITIAANPTYAWLFMYVFDKQNSFMDYRDLLFYPVETDKLLLVSDSHFQNNIEAGKELSDAYQNSQSVKVFVGNVGSYDISSYPYTNLMTSYEGYKVDIRIENLRN